MRIVGIIRGRKRQGLKYAQFFVLGVVFLFLILFKGVLNRIAEFCLSGWYRFRLKFCGFLGFVVVTCRWDLVLIVCSQISEVY